MSEIKGVIYSDPDEDRHLEVKFFPKALFYKIEFSIKDGTSAESFRLTSLEARELASHILETIPDTSVLDANLDAI